MNQVAHKEGFYWVFVLALVSLMFVRLPPMVAKQETILSTYRTLVEVDALTHQQYVEPITDERLVEGAIRGMMHQLDPYSGYISAQELPEFERRSAGDYFGLGIEVGAVNGRPVVIAPVDGSPAARAGILAGDVIIGVNGRNTEELSVLEVKRLLSGDGHTPVRMRVQQLHSARTREVTLTPGPVSIQTVRGWRRLEGRRWDYLIDPDLHIGYLRISSFYENTNSAVGEAVNELRQRGARALVLDLRFNPGGRLEQGVSVADRFLNSGLVVSTITRRQAVREYHAEAQAFDCDWKLAVLINNGSASAAEIVAGALQDHGRAVIVGERSFGKGSVQNLVRLRTDEGAVKLTTAFYRLPGGRIIHRDAQNEKLYRWGIQPDVLVELTADEEEAVQQARIVVDHTGSPVMPDAHSDELPVDRQLAEALRILSQ